MTLKQLRYFLAVAEAGSVSGAARDIFIAQPALSYQIAQLEQSLGTELMHRSVKGVQLTNAGTTLLQHARQILKQVDNAKAHVLSGEFSPRGEVSLVIDASKAYTLVAPLLKHCQQHYPDIQLKISDAMSVKAGQQMQRGGADLAFIPSAAELEGVELVAVYKEPLHLVGKNLAKQHPSGTIKFKELYQYPLVAPSKAYNIRQHIDQKALEAKRPLNIQYEQDTGLTLRCLAYHGMANAILPKDVMATELKQGDVDALQIIEPTIDRIHSLVWRTEQVQSSAVQAVQKMVVTVVQQLCDSGVLDGEVIV